MEGGRKDRSRSESSLLDVWMKRKRDDDEKKEREGEWLFAESSKTARSPREKENRGGERGKRSKEDREKGEMWEELERAGKEVGIYIEKVKKMEQELENWKKKEELLRMEGERMRERMSKLEKKIEEKEMEKK